MPVGYTRGRGGGGGAPADPGATNFGSIFRPAIRIISRLDALVANRPAFRFASVLRALVQALPALRFESRASGTSRSPVNVAINVANRVVSTLNKPSAIPAFRLTQTMINLAGVYGANAWTETVVAGRQDWTNEVNATGKQNGSFATIVGNSLGGRAGKLNLSYADFDASKTNLAIRRVRLYFVARMTGSPLVGLGIGVEFRWAKGGAETVLSSQLSNFDWTTAGGAAAGTFDITASIAGWADLNAITTHVYAEFQTLETPTLSLDAVHLLVDADRTEVL